MQIHRNMKTRELMNVKNAEINHKSIICNKMYFFPCQIKFDYFQQIHL